MCVCDVVVPCPSMCTSCAMILCSGQRGRKSANRERKQPKCKKKTKPRTPGQMQDRVSSMRRQDEIVEEGATTVDADVVVVGEGIGRRVGVGVGAGVVARADSVTGSGVDVGVAALEDGVGGGEGGVTGACGGVGVLEQLRSFKMILSLGRGSGSSVGCDMVGCDSSDELSEASGVESESNRAGGDRLLLARRRSTASPSSRSSLRRFLDGEG